MGVFEGMLLMQIRTVAIVTERKMIFFPKHEFSYYEPYSISTTSLTPKHPLTVRIKLSISIKTCETQQPTRTENLPQPANLPTT